MHSIIDLLNAIAGNPLVDEPTRARAGILLWRLQPNRRLGSIFDEVFQ